MANSLRERGYECVETLDPCTSEIITKTKFNVITLFNVLDRCSHPISLLKTCKRIMTQHDGGCLLILAVVFPFRPYVEDGIDNVDPEEKIILGKNLPWEMSVNLFAEKVLGKIGFKVLTVSKSPYVSEGDYEKDFYCITDAVFVVEVKKD
ncbi:METTL9 [Acrasis kona]